MDKEAWAQQFVAPYFDTASEEWHSVIDTTWYGLNKVESYDTDYTMYQNVSYTLNADYDKVPAYGHQLFIKIHLNETSEVRRVGTVRKHCSSYYVYEDW